MPTQKGIALINFLKWTLTEGQSFSEPLYFIPLPNTVKQSALKKLSLVKFE